jgi:ubiquinone/menaquinone biosynthesis C-methylase UbiE
MNETELRDKTEQARRRYDRISGIYDRMEAPMERGNFKGWRSLIWNDVKGPRVLEVGVGTGKNMAYYPKDLEITAIDFSPGMLSKARAKAQQQGVKVDLKLMDAQHLDFPDSTFDTVLATFVFCSVPDPVRGLRELRRVVKPDGKILLLEHVRPRGTAGTATDIVNPAVVRIWGANINRCTVENVQDAGLVVDHVDNLLRDFVKLIVASPGK